MTPDQKRQAEELAEAFKHSDGCTEGCRECYLAGFTAATEMLSAEIERLNSWAELQSKDSQEIIDDMQEQLKVYDTALEKIGFGPYPYGSTEAWFCKFAREALERGRGTK